MERRRARLTLTGDTQARNKIIENFGRFVRRNPLKSIGAAIAVPVIVSLAVSYVYNATQQFAVGAVLPGTAQVSGKLLDDEHFLEDDEFWFMQIVKRYEQDNGSKDPRRVQGEHQVHPGVRLRVLHRLR